ncbi:MAG: hypothetical protein EOO38_22895, partial [Cytophagaceae bacterium]
PEYYVERANSLVLLFRRHPTLKYDLAWSIFGLRMQMMLLSDSREVVAAAYRVMRYAFTDRKSLRIIRALHTDYLVMALSVIASIACFTGMFDTAIVHRDALIRVLSNRGNGDILKGLQTTSIWATKTVQWYVVVHVEALPVVNVRQAGNTHRSTTKRNPQGTIPPRNSSSAPPGTNPK